MMRSFYEKNLKVMSIKVVVGLLLCREDIDFFYDFGLTRIRKFAFCIYCRLIWKVHWLMITLIWLKIK